MEQYTSKLRKQKRDQQISNKRAIQGDTGDTINNLKLQQLLNDINPLLIDSTKSKEEIITYTFEILEIQSLEHQKTLLIYIRKLISSGEKYLGAYIFQKGYLPKLLKYLEGYEESIYLNMTWALSNILVDSEDAVKYLILHKLHYKFVEVAIKGNNKVKEQTLWVIGNTIAENVEARDAILQTLLVEMIINIISVESLSCSFLSVTCWVISLLCKGKSAPDTGRVKVFIPLLAKLICVDEPAIVTDCLWSLIYLTSSNQLFTKFMLCNVSVNKLLSLMQSPNTSIKKAAMRVIGNVCLGDSEEVDLILDDESAPSIFKALLNDSDPDIIREASWCISNIAADKKNRVDYLINIEIVDRLVSVLGKATLTCVQKEVFWCLANMINKSNNEQLAQLISQGIMESITEFLAFNDIQFSSMAVKLIETMLHAGVKTGEINKYAARFEEIGGKSMLELLQYNVRYWCQR
jgi:hypothetical protein